MALQRYSNNAVTTIAGPLNAAATTLNVSSGTGSTFPTVVAPQWFMGTISKSGVPSIFEIVKVTSHPGGDSFIILRGQEGTAAQTWASSDNFSLLPTAGGDLNFVQIDDLQNATQIYGTDTGTASAYVINLTPQIVELLAGTTFHFKAANTSAGTSSTMAVVTTANGTITAPLVLPSGGSVGAGQVTAGGVYQVTYDGTKFQLTSTGTYYPPLPQETQTVPTHLVNLQYTWGDIRRYGAACDGVTDDTVAVQAAFTVASNATYGAFGWEVIFPAGVPCLITSYVQIFSNTSVRLQGTLYIQNRNAGLYSVGASNILIDGVNTGTITDKTVLTGYVWNNSNLSAGNPEAPVIHLRQSTNVTVQNLYFTFVNAGVLFSDSTTNIAPSHENWVSSGNFCNRNTCRDCFFSMIEQGGATSINGTHIRIQGNYGYRMGDGGFWMMTAQFSWMKDNIHISPKATPSAVTSFGSNNQAQPTTWNDEQGFEFENCFTTEVSGNVAINHWFVGIDIKNGSDMMDVHDNFVGYNERNSILVRDGDAVKAACGRVYIHHNTVVEHGTLQYGQSKASFGYEQCPIRAGTVFDVSVTDNYISNFQCATTGTATSGISAAGICLNGPQVWISNWFPTLPQEGRAAAERNIIDFKFASFGVTGTYTMTIQETSTTPPGIIAIAAVSDLRICGNILKSDVYFAGDARVRQIPAIGVLNTVVPANGSTPNLYTPLGCKIDDNSISCFGQGGIWFGGNINNLGMPITINGNSLSGLAYCPFIYAQDANGIQICNNLCSQNSSRGNEAAIPGGSNIGNLLNGVTSAGIAVTSTNTTLSSLWSYWPVVNSNSISGAWDSPILGGQTFTLTVGIFFAYVQNASAMGNAINNVLNNNPSNPDSPGLPIAINAQPLNGSVYTYGSTGWPRQTQNSSWVNLVSHEPWYSGEVIFVIGDPGPGAVTVAMGYISGVGGNANIGWASGFGAPPNTQP